MALRYESCRIGKIKEGKLNKLIDFINKNISNKGLIYKKKKLKDTSSQMELRLFLISKKESENMLKLRIAFDTPTKILDYIKYGEEEVTIRHSILGRMIIFTKGENENYILIFLKKNRSKKMFTEINKLLGEKAIDFVNIDLPKVNMDHLTNFWASGIKDDYERNVAASGTDLEKGTTYKNVKQKRGHFSALKTKDKNLNYGLSEEGLIWVIPKENFDIDHFFSDTLKLLQNQNVLYVL